MVWFTADLHLGHDAIIKMQHRPFHSVYEMNEALIANINEHVKKNDKLYILGDICYRIEKEDAENLIRRINGEKYLVLGNHDVTGNPEVCRFDENLFEWVGYYRKDMLIPKVPIIMSHYPYMSWDKARRGSIMLHGHIHSDPIYNRENIKAGIRRFDVGTDANGYKPVSLDTIVKWAKEAGVNREKTDGYIPGVWNQYNGN